jgi:seryl-tRNA synthetase
MRHGFVPTYTPVLVKPQAMEGTGFLGQAAENVFHLEQDDFYLVGTSEVSLAAYHTDEILDAASLPRRYAGLSSCFRREAGSYGRDTRGIWRVHQFDKVEMFSFCKPEDAGAEHQRLLKWEKEFFTDLDIPFRVIDVATGDLGSSATRKFDIEAWIPTRGDYAEVTSTSNCTTFQARRLNIRMRDGGGATTPLATLNGTMVAVTRAIVAIVENHQQADGSVVVPPPLRETVGTDVIRPAKA